MKNVFISGVHNYHRVGIDEYVVRERINDAEGMIRVIHVVGDCVATLLRPDGDFQFAPHNHRQDVSLYGLRGSALNVTFMPLGKCRAGQIGYKYVFESELVDGAMRVHYRDAGDFEIKDVMPITSEGVHLESQTVHTVIAQPGSAFLIVERELATVRHPRHVNHCYSRKPDFQLTTTPDLYQPMSDLQLYRVADDFGEAAAWKLHGLGLATITARV